MTKAFRKGVVENATFSYVRLKDLRRFVSMNDQLDFGSGLLGNLAKEMHFAAFVPSKKHTPLALGKSKKDVLKQAGIDDSTNGTAAIEALQQRSQGFIIPRWGGVTIVNSENTVGKEMERFNFERFESMVLAHLRSILGLNDPYNFPISAQSSRFSFKHVKPESVGIAEWEIDSMANFRIRDHTKMLTEMVDSTLTLAQKMSGLIIHKEIGDCVNRAVENLRKCIYILNGTSEDAAVTIITPDNRRDLAFRYLREGFLAAEEANRDPSMITQQYFPLEQLLAIFCPLLLPIFFPMVIGVAEAYKREWKRWKGGEVSDSDDDDDVNAWRQSFDNHREENNSGE